jgi:hypothetical protein
MSLIDPYQIATCGQNLTNTFTLATNGILVDVVIQDLPDIPIPPDFGGGGIIPGQEWPQPPISGSQEVIKRKQITVTATIGGVEYTESIIVEDEPNLTVDNVSVDVQTTDSQPIIKISIKK